MPLTAFSVNVYEFLISNIRTSLILPRKAFPLTMKRSYEQLDEEEVVVSALSGMSQ